MEQEPQERWISVIEIAEHLGISKDTIHKWIKNKSIPSHRIGKLWKFKASEVDEWVRSGESDTTSDGGEK